MNSVLSRNNMLYALIFLLVVKFFLIPLMSWQDSEFTELTSKKRQLDKSNYLVDSHDRFEGNLKSINQNLTDAQEYFYVDSSSLKLDIQKEVEDVFLESELSITAFNWVIDSPGGIRALRAQVYFAGGTDQMVEAFWALAAQSKLINPVEWRQQIKSFGAGFGAAKGSVTLEFYALSAPRGLELVGGQAVSSVGKDQN